MANTRITQGVIKPNEDYDTRHINSTGIVTTTGLDVNGNADISGSLNIGGVLTYEDVTNVDSVGLITARKGIISSGVVTATAFHGSGANLTGIDATALKDPAGNVKVQAQASGAVHTGISTFDTVNVGSGVTIESNGQATFVGVVTFGPSSTKIDNNTINVGTALTLGHTQGVQFLTQNLHSRGFEVNQINASGIITASSFSGDGSNLTSLPAGLGTALSSTQSSPLNKIYYTNSVLPVESTITVDTPASASAAYTQYTDISLGSGADLIISDGDDLIPDVLGLRPDGTFGGGSLGRMRVDKLVGKDANSAVNVEKGLVVTGVVTATSYAGDGSSLTGLNTDLVSDSSPQLGGDLDVNNFNIKNGTSILDISASTRFEFKPQGSTVVDINAGGVDFKAGHNTHADNVQSRYGNSNDLKIYHSGAAALINNSTGDFSIQTDGNLKLEKADGGDDYIHCIADAGVEIHYAGARKIETTAAGAIITGICTATSFSGDGAGLNGTGIGRNMLINGTMQINQRSSGTLTINSSSSQYPCDRWVSRGEGGSKTFTIEKTSIASSGQGIRNALKVTSSQAASVGSSDIFNVRQMIEGYNIQRLNLGEAGCASMALSFTAYSSVAGTHSGAIQNSAQNRSYPFTYTLVANTWTDVKITIPPITSGSFNEADGVGLRVVFDLGCGNNFRGTANQWNSAQDEGATGAVRILETNGATWYVTKVQLEEGTVATKFEKRLYTEELALCERYYHQTQGNMFWMTNVNGSDHYKPIQFPTTMRAGPSISFYNVTGDGGGASPSGSTPNGYQCRLNGNGRHCSWAHKASAEI